METTYLLFSLVVFIGAVAQGVLGFGFNLITTPLMLIFIDPSNVVLRGFILSEINSIMMAWDLRKHIDYAMVWPLTIASLFGSLAGGYLLRLLNDISSFKAIMAVLVIVLTFIIMSGYRRPLKNEKFGAAIVGFISGKLGTLTSFGGPPIVIFLMNQDREPLVIKASLAIYFFLSGLFSINVILYFTEAKITLLEIIYYIPAILGGIKLGLFLSRKVKKEIFRIIVCMILICTSTYLLYTTL